MGGRGAQRHGLHSTTDWWGAAFSHSIGGENNMRMATATTTRYAHVPLSQAQKLQLVLENQTDPTKTAKKDKVGAVRSDSISEGQESRV